ncbi:MAG: hypothetical protein K5Q68_22355, partial [Roseococcus sp.]|nr:hypothetical protein [Roseococcus sp.]
KELCTGDNSPLRSMARRIARNREVLGVHYPSDSFVGQKLAARTLPLLMTCPSLVGDPTKPAAEPGMRIPEKLGLRAVFDPANPPPAAPGDPFEPVSILSPLLPNPLPPPAPATLPLVFGETGLVARARAEWS